MKKLLFIFIPLLFLVLSSCSNDTGGGVTDPFGTGNNNNNGTGNVTFTIGSQQGTQGGILFYCTPSVDVKITKVTCSLPAQNYTYPLTDDGTTIYNANVGYELMEFTGVESGQQWTFKFEGTIASNNQAFNVTSNYTVP
jgi:hypothetical protein